MGTNCSHHNHEMAEVLYRPRRVGEELWKTSSLREGVIRLCRLADEMTHGGYARLPLDWITTENATVILGLFVILRGVRFRGRSSSYTPCARKLRHCDRTPQTTLRGGRTSQRQIMNITRQNIDAGAIPHRYLRTPEAARFLGLSGRTLEKHRTYGTGPRYAKLGGRVVYRVADLQAWAELGAKASTSDPGRGRVLPARRHAEHSSTVDSGR